MRKPMCVFLFWFALAAACQQQTLSEALALQAPPPGAYVDDSARRSALRFRNAIKRLELDRIRCPLSTLPTGVVCGQALYGQLGGGDEWLGDRPLGTAVSITPVGRSIPITFGLVNAQGHFAVTLPARWTSARLCLEPHGTPAADRCRNLALGPRGARVTIYHWPWPASTTWRWARD
jgi:hypothetical protein